MFVIILRVKKNLSYLFLFH